jgi:hypothetical protein
MSPRVAELKKRQANAESKMSLRMQFLGEAFQGINTDMSSLTTRTEPTAAEPIPSFATPAKVPGLGMKIPALSLGIAKTIVREETREGAKAIDYMQDARMISERLLSTKFDVDEL